MMIYVPCNPWWQMVLNVTINTTVGVYSGSAGVLGRCGDLPVFLAFDLSSYSP